MLGMDVRASVGHNRAFKSGIDSTVQGRTKTPFEAAEAEMLKAECSMCYRVKLGPASSCERLDYFALALRGHVVGRGNIRDFDQTITFAQYNIFKCRLFQIIECLTQAHTYSLLAQSPEKWGPSPLPLTAKTEY